MNFFKTKDFVENVDINLIKPSPFQPRVHFDTERIRELSESIKNHGVLQPIVVRKVEDYYEIIAGERRFLASKTSGLTKVPVIVKNYDDKVSAELAIIENIQREDLSSIEEAIAYKQLMDIYNINQSDLANRLGKSQSSIANKIRLLNLSSNIQKAIINKDITERHGRALLKLESENLRESMLDEIVKNKYNVSKTEEVIKKKLTPKIAKPIKKVVVNKNIRLAINTINQAIQMIEKTGVKLNVEKNDLNNQYEIKIIIEK